MRRSIPSSTCLPTARGSFSRTRRRRRAPQRPRSLHDNPSLLSRFARTASPGPRSSRCIVRPRRCAYIAPPSEGGSYTPRSRGARARRARRPDGAVRLRAGRVVAPAASRHVSSYAKRARCRSSPRSRSLGRRRALRHSTSDNGAVVGEDPPPALERVRVLERRPPTVLWRMCETRTSPRLPGELEEALVFVRAGNPLVHPPAARVVADGEAPAVAVLAGERGEAARGLPEDDPEVDGLVRGDSEESAHWANQA